jgi:hypothetical protein
VLGEVGAETAAAVRADFERGLRDHFGAAPTGWVLDAAHPGAAW